MLKRFRYNTRLSAPNTSGRCSVVIRVSYCSSRIDLYSGITLFMHEWNAKKERVKQGCKVMSGYEYNVVNELIDEQEKFVRDYFNNSASRSTEPSLKDLKERFNYKYKSTQKEQSDEFFYMFDKFREEVSANKGWQKDRKDMFKRLEDKVRGFMPNIKFSDLSIATMDKFKVYLSKTMYNDALDKHLAYFKQFITWCKNKNIQIHQEFFSYQPVLPKAKKAVRYLTLDELDTIYNLKIDNADGLERARDIFIFQCYTALRVSDVSKLKHENITKENGKWYIDLVTEKDDDRINFRLANRAVAIYEKYKDNVYENDLVFPIISSQKYNEHLKSLGKLADLKGEWIDYEYRLNEKIIIKTPKHKLSTHTARRTFVVTAMNEGVSLDMIALITSHSDVNAMKPYIKANLRGADAVIKALDKASDKSKKKGSKKRDSKKPSKSNLEDNQ